MKPPTEHRRNFVKSCVGLMALGLHRRARTGTIGAHRPYAKSVLVDRKGARISASSLTVGEAFIFHYPFRATPCFLINIGAPVRGGQPMTTETGERYTWSGGVGQSQSIVAFSAICAHKMTHPAKSVSFINYRHDPISYLDHDNRTASGSHLIYCCSEKSVYDVRDGGRVLGGPAKQPLATIALEYQRETDSLYATGTFGGEMFRPYFQKFAERLELEYRATNVDAEIGDTTLVQTMKEFSESVILC